SRRVRVAGRSPAERLDLGVEFLWDYSTQPAFAALLELFPASKTDEDLRSALLSADRTAADLVFDTMARLVGEEHAAHSNFHRNVRLLGLTIYGVGITRDLRSSRREPQLLRELKEMGRELFGLASVRS